MVKLYPEKLLSIITNDSMQERLECMFKKYGVSGFTIIQASGEGSSGMASEMSGFDGNILVKVIVPESQLQVLLESVERKLRKGYHLTVFVSDVQVITPEKFNKKSQ